MQTGIVSDIIFSKVIGGKKLTKDGGCVFEMTFSADIGKERRGRNCKNTSKQVTGESISTRSRSGVRSVSADHVIDRSHVDTVVRDTDNGRKHHRAHPVQRRARTGPGETDQSNGQTRRGVEQPPESRLILHVLIERVLLSLRGVLPDNREERKPGDDIADQDRQEGETQGDGAKVPVLVHQSKGLDEHEDQRIAETTEQRKSQHDRLGHQHLEGANPGDQDLAHGEPLAPGEDFIGAVDVEAGVLLALLLGELVEHDSRAGFGDEQEMHNLDKSTEDKLDPDRPPPGQESLNEASHEGSNDRAGDGREHHASHGILLSVCLPQVCDHTQGNGTTSQTQTTKGTADHDCGEVGRQSHGQLPEVGKEHTELQDGLPTQFLTPRRPQLTTKSVRDQVNHGTAAGTLLTDAEFLRDTTNTVRIQTGVEVHRGLDEENHGENHPFPPGGETEAQRLVAIGFGEDDAIVGSRVFEVVERALSRLAGDILETERLFLHVDIVSRRIVGLLSGGRVGSRHDVFLLPQMKKKKAVMEFTDESRLYLKKRKRNATGRMLTIYRKPGEAGGTGEAGYGAVTGWQPTTQSMPSHTGCRLAKPIRNPGEKRNRDRGFVVLNMARFSKIHPVHGRSPSPNVMLRPDPGSTCRWRNFHEQVPEFAGSGIGVNRSIGSLSVLDRVGASNQSVSCGGKRGTRRRKTAMP